MLLKKSFGVGKTAYDAVKEELKVLQSLDHPNVLWLHEIIDEPGSTKNMYLTMSKNMIMHDNMDYTYDMPCLKTLDLWK